MDAYTSRRLRPDPAQLELIGRLARLQPVVEAYHEARSLASKSRMDASSDSTLGRGTMEMGSIESPAEMKMGSIESGTKARKSASIEKSSTPEMGAIESGMESRKSASIEKSNTLEMGAIEPRTESRKSASMEKSITLEMGSIESGTEARKSASIEELSTPEMGAIDSSMNSIVSGMPSVKWSSMSRMGSTDSGTGLITPSLAKQSSMPEMGLGLGLMTPASSKQSSMPEIRSIDARMESNTLESTKPEAGKSAPGWNKFEMDSVDSKPAIGLSAIKAVADKNTMSPTKPIADSPLRIPKGLYVYGAVGSGKTMLMDLFFQAVDVTKKRVHVHSFLQSVHAYIHDAKRQRNVGGRTAIEDLGKALSRDATLIAFDEFAIADAADAVVLGVLVESILKSGSVLVATSNTAPEDLHQGFDPFKPRLLAYCRVHDLNSAMDYRERDMDEGDAIIDAINGLVVEENESDPQVKFRLLIPGSASQNVVLKVGFGREIEVPFVWRDEQGRNTFAASFDWLCGGNTAFGANEYEALLNRYERAIIGCAQPIRVVPGQAGNTSRRFTTFLDIAYEKKRNLLLTSQSADLFQFDHVEDESNESIASIRAFLRARSRWNEMSRGLHVS